ncbi:hypothetical protein HanIR_Chr07g0332281 [Helianthus annuus]|nr:hypothetical protein HanIR_Chr07g0332281 [Helianthus annuus]KAJ0564093.1 hypothetical protein HanHA89_Chr07g0270461 [Helianthus annuus]KAJ0729424.1 hypothetical protein HanLR1_Chr07g0252791 [Helianthus annuus]
MVERIAKLQSEKRAICQKRKMNSTNEKKEVMVERIKKVHSEKQAKCQKK